MVSVRLWMQGDLDYVAESVYREGWGHIRQDVERCWQFEPNGCFIAKIGGKRVGHVFSICYGKAGWVGLLIVDPENRGRGVGTVLMKSAISYLRGKGVETIRLEAVDKAVPLYRRLGFREEYLSLRFRGRLEHWLGERRSVKRGSGTEVLEVKERDIVQLAAFDSRFFGVDRLRVLQRLYEDQPRGRCLVAKRSRSVLGYVMSRPVGDAFWVGPWVCVDSETAEMLLCACAEAVGRKVEPELRLGMPAANRAGVGLMKKYDFSLTESSVRMVWGGLDCVGDVEGIYGIGGPEKG